MEEDHSAVFVILLIYSTNLYSIYIFVMSRFCYLFYSKHFKFCLSKKQNSATNVALYFWFNKFLQKSFSHFLLVAVCETKQALVKNTKACACCVTTSGNLYFFKRPDGTDKVPDIFIVEVLTTIAKGYSMRIICSKFGGTPIVGISKIAQVLKLQVCI